ncbi:MAG: hypothetical protein M1820_001797 [Bogoriella megaspora]|nr:MAG: hypothetical protein M1820_001797 [Bogoriella megaspora]
MAAAASPVLSVKPEQYHEEANPELARSAAREPSLSTSSYVPQDQSNGIPSQLEVHVNSRWLRFYGWDITAPGKSRTIFHLSTGHRGREQVTLHQGDSSGPILATVTFNSRNTTGTRGYNMEFPTATGPQQVNIPRPHYRRKIKASIRLPDQINLAGKPLTVERTNDEGGASKIRRPGSKLVDASGKTCAVFMENYFRGHCPPGTISFQQPQLSDELKVQIVCCFVMERERSRRIEIASAGGGVGTSYFA